MVKVRECGTAGLRMRRPRVWNLCLRNLETGALTRLTSVPFGQIWSADDLISARRPRCPARIPKSAAGPRGQMSYDYGIAGQVPDAALMLEISSSRSLRSLLATSTPAGGVPAVEPPVGRPAAV